MVVEMSLGKRFVASRSICPLSFGSNTRQAGRNFGASATKLVSGTDRQQPHRRKEKGVPFVPVNSHSRVVTFRRRMTPGGRRRVRLDTGPDRVSGRHNEAVPRPGRGTLARDRSRRQQDCGRLPRWTVTEYSNSHGQSADSIRRANAFELRPRWANSPIVADQGCPALSATAPWTRLPGNCQ